MSKNGKAAIEVFLDRLALLDRPLQRTVVELRGGSVYVQELGPRDLRAAQSQMNGVAGDGIDATISVVIAATVDAAGAPLFTEADRESLLDQPLGEMNAIAAAAFQLSGIELPTEAANTTDPLVV